MADAELQSGVSKAAKKNKKRRNKKPNQEEGQGSSPGDTTPAADPLEDLKVKLAEAKAKQDHPLASKLRQQIWLLQDDAAGVKPELDPQILSSLETNLPKNAEKKAEVEEKPVTSDATIDKQLKSLRKKLQQIEKLKQRKAGGEKLESNQMAKVEKEQEVRDEIEEIEILMRQAALGLL
ncbi:eukaryotic translation initiation factor 2A-like [Branchiostoma lanceolatum]|uniref:eukaryotic translation initiation factor 2A-like n=1 Tax=Branchiostoma lanceolatum TaxID=7740 RepID=UPI003456C78B